MRRDRALNNRVPGTLFHRPIDFTIILAYLSLISLPYISIPRFCRINYSAFTILTESKTAINFCRNLFSLRLFFKIYLIFSLPFVIPHLSPLQVFDLNKYQSAAEPPFFGFSIFEKDTISRFLHVSKSFWVSLSLSPPFPGGIGIEIDEF